MSIKSIFTSFLLLSGICTHAQTWTSLTDFPGSERDDAAGFVIGSNFYVGTGLDAGFNATRDFFILDMNTDTWSAGSSLPAMKERQYATACSDGSYGYISCGIGPGATYFNDLYRFDPSTSSWQAMSPLPGLGRRGASAFVINNEIYISGGNNPSQTTIREVWKYTIQNDSWQQLNDFPFPSLWRSAACSVNGKGYVFGGIDSLGQYNAVLYEYNPVNDQWTMRAQFPFNGRSYLQLLPIANDVLFYGGYENGNVYPNDVFIYNFSLNAFVPYTGLPGLARRGYVACSYNNSIYISTGLVSTPARTAETWKISNVVGGSETKVDLFSAYPNPFSSSITINADGQLEIFDALGRLVISKTISAGVVDLGDLQEGVYCLRFSERKGKSFSLKIIKEDR